MRVLVVRNAFTFAPPPATEGAEAPEPRSFAVGEMIRDPADIDGVTAAGQHHHCTPADVDESFFTEDAPAGARKSKPDAAA